MHDRLNNALDWWCSDEVNVNGEQPDESSWRALRRALDSVLKQSGGDAPRALRRAQWIANEPEKRTWAVMFMCLNAALNETKNNP